jgi:hypothetical protein
LLFLFKTVIVPASLSALKRENLADKFRELGKNVLIV